MPRSQRLRRGGCTCPCSCPCCRQWSPTEELLARELIRSDADSLPCRKSCRCACCGCCFDRRCVKASYIIFILVLVGALFMSSVGVLGVLPYARTSGFLSTQCTTVSSTYTGKTFRCGKASCEGSTICDSYPCLLVKVAHVTLGGANITTSLFDTQEELFGRGEQAVCAVQPERCGSRSTPSDDVRRFETQYGVSGQTFECLTNPDDGTQVIRHRSQVPLFSVLFVIATGLLFIIGLVGLVVTALTCGCHCKVLCSGRPPFVIREKAAVHVAQPYTISTHCYIPRESIS